MSAVSTCFSLPNELWIYTGRYLSIEDLIICSLVCKFFRTWAFDPSFFGKKILKYKIITLPSHYLFEWSQYNKRCAPLLRASKMQKQLPPQEDSSSGKAKEIISVNQPTGMAEKIASLKNFAAPSYEEIIACYGIILQYVARAQVEDAHLWMLSDLLLKEHCHLPIKESLNLLEYLAKNRDFCSEGGVFATKEIFYLLSFAKENREEIIAIIDSLRLFKPQLDPMDVAINEGNLEKVKSSMEAMLEAQFSDSRTEKANFSAADTSFGDYLHRAIKIWMSQPKSSNQANQERLQIIFYLLDQNILISISTFTLATLTGSWELFKPLAESFFAQRYKFRSGLFEPGTDISTVNQLMTPLGVGVANMEDILLSHFSKDQLSQLCLKK